MVLWRGAQLRRAYGTVLRERFNDLQRDDGVHCPVLVGQPLFQTVHLSRPMADPALMIEDDAGELADLEPASSRAAAACAASPAARNRSLATRSRSGSNGSLIVATSDIDRTPASQGMTPPSKTGGSYPDVHDRPDTYGSASPAGGGRRVPTCQYSNPTSSDDSAAARPDGKASTAHAKKTKRCETVLDAPYTPANHGGGHAVRCDRHS